jgi:hypothetical protein
MRWNFMLVIDRDSVFSDKGSLNLQHVHAEILVVQAQALPKEVRVSEFPKFHVQRDSLNDHHIETIEDAETP